MNHRMRSRLVPYALLALAFACTESGLEPVRDSIALDLRPVFASEYAGTESLPINRIRLTVRDAATGAVLLSRPFDVAPDAAPWQIQLDVPVRTQGQRIVVAVELVNVTGGVETVEWSGLVGPIDVSPGAQSTPHSVQVHPGPLDNLTVTSVTLHDAPESMIEGDVARLRTAVEAAAGANVRVFWSTSDAAILGVDQSGNVTALLPGSALITAAAGRHRADALITVRARPAALVIEPGSARIEQLGGSVAFSARAVDARGGNVAGTVEWSTDSPSVLAHDGNGRFTALANGTATVTATLVGQPSITATAAVEVAQRAATVMVDPAAATLATRGATVQLAAHVLDAGGTAIADVAIAWSSSNTAVAAVTATGLVTAHDNGTATVTAMAAGIEGSALITVRTVASVEITAGNAQTAAVASVLPIVPAVRVTDASGAPVAGVVVSFAVAPGSGSLAHETVVTDAAGTARAGPWTLGTVAGTHSLTASVGGAHVTFTATATAGAAANIAETAGNAQTGPVGLTLPVRPTVRVTDRFGNPVGGAIVAFTADNGATATPATVATDADGLAGTAWRLGTATGAYTLRAAVTGAGTVTFTATAEPLVPAALEIVEGDGQSAPAGATLPSALAVRVVDASGRPIPGVTVTFTAHGDGSSIDGGIAVSGTDGIAFAGAWTLGPTPGSYTVTAAVDGVPTVTFTAEAIAGSAALSGTVVSATSAQPVAGAIVVLQSASGTQHQAVTGSAGEYAFTGIAPGSWTVRITATGFAGFTGTVELQDGAAATRNFAILPETSGDQVSIVLTWNANPRDLDSHLDVPAFEGQGPYHVAYYARGSADVYPFATLDIDITSGHGPETIVIAQQVSGTYTYRVRRFSGSPALSASGATVQVYRGNTRIATFTVPDQVGDWWTVFTLNGTTLTPINQIDGGTSQDEVSASGALDLAK